MEGTLRERRLRLPTRLLESTNLKAEIPRIEINNKTPQSGSFLITPRNVQPTALPTPLQTFITSTTSLATATSINVPQGTPTTTAFPTQGTPTTATAFPRVTGSALGVNGTGSITQGSQAAGISAASADASNGAMVLAGISGAAGISLLGVTALFIAKRRRIPSSRNLEPQNPSDSPDTARAQAFQAGRLPRPYSSRYRL